MKSSVFRTVSAVLLATLVMHVSAHSHLAIPKPTRTLVCRAGNNNPGPRDCYGPCPPMDTYGNPSGINEDNPAATWTRGSSQPVKWHKNNHKGRESASGASGFTRLALVPVDQMFDKDAHQKYAFHYACWGAGKERCPSRDYEACGNDEDGERYGTTITVPTSYADGVYVLGYSWFGGGDYKEDSFFGDYYSCSFVKIQGGPKTDTSSAVFAPGSGMPADSCFSAADRSGVCVKEPCLGKEMKQMTPYGSNFEIGTTSAGAPAPASAPEPAPAPSTDSTSAPATISASTAAAAAVTEGAQSRDGPISKISFVNIATNAKAALYDSHTFYTRDYPSGFSIEAEVANSPQSVEFIWDGGSKTERQAPYYLAGNSGARIVKWWNYPTNRAFGLEVKATVDGKAYSKKVTLTIKQ